MYFGFCTDRWHLSSYTRFVAGAQKNSEKYIRDCLDNNTVRE